MNAAILLLIRVASYVFPWGTAWYLSRQFLTPHRYARPKWEEELLQSATPLLLAGNMRGWSWGAGPPVLLVHGWDGRGAQLGKFAPLLVKQGFKVVAFDGPAHGDSPGQSTHLAEFAEAMLRIEKQVGPIDSVIAHSFGGGATMLAVLRGFKVRRLVLMASPSAIQGVLDRFCAFLGISSFSARLFQARIVSRVGFGPQEADIAQFRKLSADHLPEVLVVHSVDDAEVPFSEAERIARELPSARLLRLTGLGHRRILKAEASLKAVSEFISQKAPRVVGGN